MIDDEVLDKEEKASIERFINTEVFEDFKNNNIVYSSTGRLSAISHVLSCDEKVWKHPSSLYTSFSRSDDEDPDPYISTMITIVPNLSEHFDSKYFSFHDDINFLLTNGYNNVKIENHYPEFFKSEQLVKILDYYEDYLDYIGWDKLSKPLDESSKSKKHYLWLDNNENSSILYEALDNWEADKKDKWCALVSANSMGTCLKTVGEYLGHFKNSIPVSSIDEELLDLESVFSYLSSLFPSRLSNVLRNYYQIGEQGVNFLSDDESYEKLDNCIKEAVTIVNYLNRSERPVKDILLVQEWDQKKTYLLHPSVKNTIAILNYALIASKNDARSYEQFNVENMTAREFVDFFYVFDSQFLKNGNFDSTNKILNKDDYNFKKRTSIDIEKVLLNHCERIKDKKNVFDDIRCLAEYFTASYSILNSYETENDFYKKVRNPLMRFLTNDEFNLFEDKRIMVNFKKVILNDSYIFGMFTKNPQCFVEINETINKGVLKEIDPKKIDFTKNVLNLLKNSEKSRKVFEDFVMDPSLTFEMMLYLGGVDCLDYS